MRTCSGTRPTSSWSSRYIACSGVSPYLMPPCGNCQEWVRIRLPQNTWFLGLSRTMPTLGLNPSRSSIINLDSCVDRLLHRHDASQTLAPLADRRPYRFRRLVNASPRPRPADESKPVLRLDAEGSPGGRRGREPPAHAARR